MKKTLVLGASPNPNRYSYKAVKLLSRYQHDIVAIGGRESAIDDIQIVKGMPNLDDIHTVTLYLGAPRQAEYFDYIIDLKPKRIIFNPGTENPKLAKLAEQNGIVTVEHCTLVMLNSGIY